VSGEPIHPRPSTPTPSAAPRKVSNLALRMLTASIVIPLVMWLIVIGGVPYLLAIIFITVMGLREFYRLIEDKGAHPLVGFGLAAGVALPCVAFFGNEYHTTLLMTAVLLGVMVAQVGKAEITEALASISGTFFGVFYVAWLLSHAIVLRQFHDVVAARFGPYSAEKIAPDAGAFYMMFAVFALVGCDAGAYFAGRKWGKRKLAPQISPGKTVEGALGGVVGGTLNALLCKAIFDLWWPELSAFFPWIAALLFAAVLTVVGIIGDLVESLLKRDAQRKDAGSVLPGMGGFLDRIDSSLLGIPVMYYLLLSYTYLRLGSP
jgi:phosphatidate cytidylyltransferase